MACWQGFAAAAEPLREEEDPYHQEPLQELPFQPVEQKEFKPLDFNNPRLAYGTKTTAELVRNYLVLSVCQIKPVVRVSPA